MLLKKFISFWLMPLPLCLALLVAGWWLFRSPRRAGFGRFLLGAGILLLLLFSNEAVSTSLVRPLERLYPPVPELIPGRAAPPALAGCRFVVVLGSGNGDTPGLPATAKLGSSALSRLVEAVRLLRVLPEAELIVSGPAREPHPSHARVLAEAAVALGIRRDRIRLVEFARDTEEESVAVRRLAGDARVALVTSANHMARAMKLFHRAGVRALACPSDYTSRPGPEFRWGDLGWDVDSLGRSTAAAHEGAWVCFGFR